MANIPLKRGMLLRHQNHVYEVTDFAEHHAGKQKPTVHVSLRDIRDGRPVDRSLDDLLPIQEVQRSYRRAQYLYAKGLVRVFMDAGNFEEYEVTEAQLGGRGAFLVEGAEYRSVWIDGALATVELPDIISAKVTVTAAPSHSVGTAANITKEATLENGLVIRVPLFIKSGDSIKVDTRTRGYAGKDHV